MLILTRKIDQGIVIAGNIHVRVLGVDRDRVKIGISAPLDVTILRDELLERDAQEAEKTNTNSNIGANTESEASAPSEEKETPATGS